LPSLQKIDQMLGLRSWGLILYGALPACLSLLGFIEIKVGKIQGQGLHTLWILPIACLPLIVTFLLVRAREREWYFTEDYLCLRSAVTTGLIVLCATAIAGVAGIIRQEYVFSFPPLQDGGQALAECFLFGIASLVLSSTLFATVLTKGTDLPGLPSSGFVGAIARIRQQLIAIQQSFIWNAYEANNKKFEELNTEGAKLVTELRFALSQPGNRLAKKNLGLKPLESDIVIFIKSVSSIKDEEVADTKEFKWQAYFADFNHLQGDQLESLTNERNRDKIAYEVMQRIKSLHLGG
jgi:hypothetical protein